jgi:SanA protein
MTMLQNLKTKLVFLKKKSVKRSIYVTVLLALFSGLTILYADHVIEKAATGKTFSGVNDLPNVKVGLLLGTSKHISNGGPNQYFSNRITAAIELFKAGKIEDIIISGDNSRKGYDEPTDMRNELIKNGIDSTRIYLDYAGFRTFDSMVRLKEIFGQKQAIIISQKFHNERAIYIAEKLGIQTFGYNAGEVEKYFGIKTAIREKFARVKVILDFMFGVQPKFLGEKIEIK